MPEKAFCLYAPVYHRGHRDWWIRHPEAKTVVLVAGQMLTDVAPTHKDIHALSVEEMALVVKAVGCFDEVIIINDEKKAKILQDYQLLVPDDEELLEWLITQGVAQKQLQVENIWLRWTRKRAMARQEISGAKLLRTTDPVWQERLCQAQLLGQKSSDWWRQVGAILWLADGRILTGHNRHLPEAETPTIRGDIRGQFHRGEHWELGTAIHAEAALIAQAAKKGYQTADATLLVTDFPCPNCAKLIGEAGIKTVYFGQGYSIADGEEVLASYGVELWQVVDESARAESSEK